MVVTKPILGWSFSALETVDGELFNRFAISLIVAGFPSFISFPFYGQFQPLLESALYELLAESIHPFRSVPIEHPVELAGLFPRSTCTSTGLLVLDTCRESAVFGIIQRFGNHILLCIPKILGQIIDNHLINGKTRK